ncbi:hypothetical protein MTO96_044853 [Rhipicephalus appendiculatus]
MATTSSEVLLSEDAHGDHMERTEACQTTSQPSASAETTTIKGARKLRALSTRQCQNPYPHTPTSRPKTRGTGKTTAPQARQAAKGKTAKAATKPKKASSTAERPPPPVPSHHSPPTLPSCAAGKQDRVK